jgi:hypothetical protein
MNKIILVVVVVIAIALVSFGGWLIFADSSSKNPVRTEFVQKNIKWFDDDRGDKTYSARILGSGIGETEDGRKFEWVAYCDSRSVMRFNISKKLPNFLPNYKARTFSGVLTQLLAKQGDTSAAFPAEIEKDRPCEITLVMDNEWARWLGDDCHKALNHYIIEIRNKIADLKVLDVTEYINSVAAPDQQLYRY